MSDAAIWWLRSPYTFDDFYVWGVSTDGSDSYSWYNGSCGVRPAFILPSTLVVSDDGTVSVNTAPTVSTDGAALGKKNAAFAWKYTVRDADGDTLTVTEKLDGKTTKTRTGVASGTALTFEQTASAAGFQKILNGNHTITVEVSDGKETVSTSATFTKAVHAASVTLAEPLTVEGDITVNLIRQQLEVESVNCRLLDNSIGYIQITTFNAQTSEQFSDALKTLEKIGAKALLIDVRQNSGGVTSVLKPILNNFVPSAIAATVEYSDGSRKTLIETDATETLDLPAAVLVDSGTASAAELFAAVMRDEYGAVLIGTTTYGKAVMQNTSEFSAGRALTLSVGRIYTKSGTWNDTGLKPDYSVELTAGTTPDAVDDDSDAQLQKALEVLAPRIPTE